MALFIALLFLASVHGADEPQLWTSVPLEALHHHAREAARSGDNPTALDYLGALEARLLAGEGMEPADSVGALALLGDLRLRAGDQEGAEAAFRLLAGRFPGVTPCPRCPPRRVRHAPAPSVCRCPPATAPPRASEEERGR
jgi:hypothetical protein